MSHSMALPMQGQVSTSADMCSAAAGGRGINVRTAAQFRAATAVERRTLPHFWLLP